jgi:HEAT repeat protein
MREDHNPENLQRFLESDDTSLVLMGLSMAKGVGVDDSLLSRVLYLSLYAEEEAIRTSAAQVFEQYAPEDAQDVISALSKPFYSMRHVGKHFATRCEVTKNLVVDALIMCLQNEDSRPCWSDNYQTSRGHAADALGEIGDLRAVEPLLATWYKNDEVYSATSIVKAFCKIGDTRAVAPLIQILSESEYPEKNIVDVLARLGDARIIETLINAIGTWAHHAHNELLFFGGVAFEPLVNDVMDGPGDITQWDDENNASVLAKIGGVHAVKTLIHAPQIIRDREHSLDVRDNIFAIGNGAIEPLLEVIEDEKEDNSIQYWAALALAKFGDVRAVEPLIRALKGADSDVRAEAAYELGEFGDSRAVEPLLSALKNENEFVREEAANALELLNNATTDDDANAEKQLATKAGEAIDHDAVEESINLSGDDDSEVRQNAIETLGQIGDTRAVEPLINALHDNDADVRQEAIEALGRIGDPRAVEPLLNALQDQDTYVREEVIEALGKIGDPHAVEPLISLLGDYELNVSAIEALCGIDDTRAAGRVILEVEHLIDALGDTDGDENYSAWGAIGALVKIGDAAIGPLVDALANRNCYISRHATESLIKIGYSAVEPLISALDHEASSVRWRAAKILGATGDDRALEPLINALRDEDWQVRLYATDALGQLGDMRAVEPLNSVLGDDEWWVRRNTVSVLGKMGNSRAVEPLIGALGDEQREVQEVAVRVLSEFGDARAVGPLTEFLGDDKPYTLESGSTIHTMKDIASEALKRLGHDAGR